MTIVQLTNEQAEAARSLGCRFIPATEAQVRQFSMQRRVFVIGGEPFLAAREDGFYETAGTLQALIASAMQPRQPAAEAPAAPAPAPETLPEPAAVMTAAEPDEAENEAEPEEPEAVPEAAPQTLYVPPVAVDFPSSHRGTPPETAPVMAATVTIVKGYARRGTLDTDGLTMLVATVHETLRRLR